MARAKKQPNKLQRLWYVISAAYGNYKKHLLILTFLALAGGIFEGVGINALIPLLSFMLDDAFVPDAITATIAHMFGLLGIPFTLAPLLVFIVLLFLVKAIILFVFQYISVHIISGYEYMTRLHLFGATLGTKWSEVMKQKIGYLETVLLTDVRQSAVLLQTIIQAIMRFSIAFVYMVVALTIDAQLTAITVLFGVVLLYVAKPLMSKTKAYSGAMTSLNKKIAHYVNQAIVGMKTIKTTAHIGKATQQGDALFSDYKKQRIGLTLIRYGAVMFIEPLSIIFIISVLWFAYQQPDFVFSSFLVVIYLIYKLFSYVKMAQGSLHKITTMFPYVEALLCHQEKLHDHQEIDRGTQDFVFSKKISFDSVTFRYANADEAIFKQLSLDIHKGEMLGLIGPSGAGKTTFVDMMLRLFEPDAGTISVDGVVSDDILLTKWRARVGYVSQDVFLLNDTIANNVRFFESDITDAEVKKALEDAGLGAHVASLKQGVHTQVGERGLHFSAGQRQRVHIARVLVRKPEVLILDEATSALDAETEQHIQSVIEHVRDTMTVVVIAHRLSTVMSCDRLVVLDQGSIVEQGAPDTLLKDKDSYFYKTYHIAD